MVTFDLHIAIAHRNTHFVSLIFERRSNVGKCLTLTVSRHKCIIITKRYSVIVVCM